MNEESQRNARVRAKLAVLRTRYAEGMPDRLHEIEALWSEYTAKADTGILASLRNKVHQLAGTATMYGFPELGQAASDAEDALEVVQDNERLDAREMAEKALSELTANPITLQG